MYVPNESTGAVSNANWSPGAYPETLSEPHRNARGQRLDPSGDHHLLRPQRAPAVAVHERVTLFAVNVQWFTAPMAYEEDANVAIRPRQSSSTTTR